MSGNDEIKVVWKTNCKWRDHEHLGKRKHVKPKNADKKDYATQPLKPGDPAKFKFGSNWFDVEVAEEWPKANDKESTVEISVDPSEIVVEDPYQQFLAQQIEREGLWKEEYAQIRKKTPNGKEKKGELQVRNRCGTTPQQNEVAEKEDSASINLYEEQLRLKTLECEALSKRVDVLEKNYLAVEKLNVIEKMQSSTMEVLSRIEQRLECIEASCANSSMTVDGSGNCEAISPALPVHCLEETAVDLPTIDLDAFKRLCENTSTPIPDSYTQEVTENHALSDDFIKTFVTPKKVKKVQDAMETEKEPHRCALKLLRYIFTNKELENCNTAGTNGKDPLDSHKLNYLKVLIFSRYKAKTKEEEEKTWKNIKAKINTKCRAKRFSHAIKTEKLPAANVET